LFRKLSQLIKSKLPHKLSTASNKHDGQALAPNSNMVKPPKKAYLIFAIVGLALLMASIDSTIVAVGLPTLLVDLETNLALVGWTLTGYQFAQSVIMPITGKLSDEWGRKPLFLGAVGLFTLSSVAAGLAPNIYLLIIFRILQGIGGGTFLPSATGIISDAFGSRRAQAIGLFGSIFPIGGIIGPNIGGFILDNFSWRWIFFVNIPIGVLLLVFGAMVLPQKSQTMNSANRKLDTMGIGLFVGAIFSILYGITNWANSPSGFSITTGVLFALSGILFFLFVRHEDRTAYPMLDMRLLRWRPFVAVNIYNFLFGAVIFGVTSFIPYYATIAFGMTPGQDGLLLTPRSIASILVSFITSIYIIRFRYRMPMIAGLIIISSSLFLLSRGYHDITILGVGLHNMVLLASLVALVGIGMGIANPASNNAALDLIPDKVAAAAGMRGMARSVGGVLGTAAVSLILSYFPDKARGMQYIYVGLAVIMIAIIPIVFMIPDTAADRAHGRSMVHYDNGTGGAKSE
jgi:EmrB/QacA subfamily drug resistance transporter